MLTPEPSTTLQLVAYIAAKMAGTPYQNRHAAVQRREVPDQRSHDSVLQHFQTVPEQRSLFAADGLLDFERALQYSRGHHHVDEYNHEGHDRGKRSRLQGELG